MAKDFQEQKWVKFTPHYLVWVCPASYHKSDECRSQCIRQGRYCTPDPDGDLAKGYSGADIVQVCSWRAVSLAQFAVFLGVRPLLHARLRQRPAEGCSGADIVQVHTHSAESVHQISHK